MINDLLNPTIEGLEIYDTILLLLGFGCVVTTALFALSYGLFYRWRKNSAGRSTMYLVASLFFMFGLGVLARGVSPVYPGKSLLTTVVFVAVLVTLFRLLITLWMHFVDRGVKVTPNEFSDDTLPGR